MNHSSPELSPLVVSQDFALAPTLDPLVTNPVERVISVELVLANLARNRQSEDQIGHLPLQKGLLPEVGSLPEESASFVEVWLPVAAQMLALPGVGHSVEMMALLSSKAPGNSLGLQSAALLAEVECVPRLALGTVNLKLRQ